MLDIIAIIIVIGAFGGFVMIKKRKYIKFLMKEQNLTQTEICKCYEPLIQNFSKVSGAKIYWDWFGLFDKRDTLNAASGPFSLILVKPTWIKKLLLSDQNVKNAFLHTLGHEMGHKAKEPHWSLFPSKKARFKNWVRECRADFYGVQFVQLKYGTERDEILKGIDIKINHNAPDKAERDKHRFLHPSWNFRRALLEKYVVFGEEVIKHIAEEAGVSNKKIIGKLIKQGKLEIVTEDEKREVCDRIYEYIVTECLDIIDDKVFKATSVNELGAIYCQYIVDNVEGASFELIAKVMQAVFIKKLTPDRIEVYKLLCDYLEIKHLPAITIAEVNTQYKELFVDMYTSVDQAFNKEISLTEERIAQLNKLIVNISGDPTYKNIMGDIDAVEEKLRAWFTEIKELDTRKNRLCFSKEYIDKKLLSFCDINDANSVENAKKKEAILMAQEDSLDARRHFLAFKGYLEAFADDLARPYAMYYKVKYFAIIEDKRKKFYKGLLTGARDAQEAYVDELNALPSIDVLHNQKQANSSGYNSSLNRILSENNVIERLIEQINENSSLRNRKELLLESIDLFNKKRYDLFNNVMPIQIEGVFADYLYDSTTFVRFSKMELYFDAVLKTKIEILQNIGSNIYPEAVAYFKFYFNNLIRNRIAHGQYAIGSSNNIEKEIFAQELILDIYMLVHMLSRNSEIEKMQRFIRGYQSYYSKVMSDTQNPCFGPLFNDLIGHKTIFSYDGVENYDPLQVAYWLINPHYEKVYKETVGDSQLIDLRNIFLSKDFWEYVLDQFEKVEKNGYDYLRINPKTSSVVKSLFRCNISSDTRDTLKKIMSKLSTIKSLG